MRSTLLIALIFLASACETVPLGSRCTVNTDCDRNTMSPIARCVAVTTGAPCSSGGACLCCPIDLDASSTDIQTACRPQGTANDAVITSDATSSDATRTCMSTATCAVGFACQNHQCIRVGTSPNGSNCNAPTDCASGYCVETYCCNSMCSESGHSCNISDDFAGTCMVGIGRTDGGAPDVLMSVDVVDTVVLPDVTVEPDVAKTPDASSDMDADADI